MITINRAIEILMRLRTESPLGGETVLVNCRSGLEDMAVMDIRVVVDPDGAVVLLLTDDEEDDGS